MKLHFPSLRWFGALLLIVILVGTAYPVQAHAFLLRSDPADNAVLSQPPAQIRLWFSEPVSEKLSTLQLYDQNGEAVPVNAIQSDPTDSRQLVLLLSTLKPGTYSLHWRVFSSTDGHYSQGLLVYGIGEIRGTSVNKQAAAGSISVVESAARAVNDLMLCALVGAQMIGLAVLFPRKPYGEPTLRILADARRRVTVWSAITDALALAAGCILLVTQAGGLSPDGPLWRSASGLLLSTDLGKVWLARQILLVITFGVVLFRQKRKAKLPNRFIWWVALIFSSAALVTLAFSGHAAGLDHPLLPMIAIAFHGLAASLWVGGLLALLMGLYPALKHSGDQREWVTATWGRFGRYAMLGVLLVFASGIFSASREVINLGGLVNTLYGQVLLGKTALVLLTGMLGLINSFLLHPGLAKWLRKPAAWLPLPPKNLPRVILSEAVLGISVFVLVGVLTAQAPANRAEDRYAGLQQVDMLTQQSDDLIVSLSVRPNHPGQNMMLLQPVSTRRPAPAEIMRVMVRATYLGFDIGTVSGDAVLLKDGQYQLGGAMLSLPGPWKVNVVVRRKGMLDTTASFQWNVLPLSGENTPAWEGLPLAGGLEWMAGLLFLSFVLVCVWQIRRAGRTSNSETTDQALSTWSVLDRS